jgi:hypothetical protein
VACADLNHVAASPSEKEIEAIDGIRHGEVVIVSTVMKD